MKLVLQRVHKAAVFVGQKCVGKCAKGFCILAGMEETDTDEVIQKMAQKTVQLRVFEDENGKMNKSLIDVRGAALIVSQFTLLADCRSGRRPSFTGAGNPQKAAQLFQQFVQAVKAWHIPVETGVFGADMTVHIENDGPATFILEGSNE